MIRAEGPSFSRSRTGRIIVAAILTVVIVVVTGIASVQHHASTARRATSSLSVARALSAGSPEIGSSHYAVPADAIFASAAARGHSTGSISAPFDTVQSAITAARDGSTVVIRGGDYHESLVLPAGKKITLQPYPGEAVWFDGSVAVTSWTGVGRAWMSSGWTASFDSSPTYTKGAADGTAEGWGFVDPKHPLAAHPDQAWIDGVALRQVGSIGELTNDSFYVDPHAHALYIGSDPAGHDVRASDLEKAMTIVGDASVVRGIGLRRFAPSVADIGAVYVAAKGATLSSLVITEMSTTGLSIDASGVTVSRVTVSNNGLLGLHANYADGLLVTRLLSTGNNTELFNLSPVSGGAKITRSRNVSVTDSDLTNNLGSGLWFDESVRGATVANNDIVANSGNALVLEISSQFIVANNVIAENTLGGIVISDSNHVEVWNNTVTGNRRDLTVGQDSRVASDLSAAGHDPRQTLPDPSVTWLAGAITVRNNVFADSTGNCILCVEDFSHRRSASQMTVVVNNNLYQRDSADQPTWAIVWSRGAGDPAVFDRVSDFTAATGQDRTSLAIEGRPVLTASATQRPIVTDSAVTIATPLPRSIATAIGRSVGDLHLGAYAR